MLYHNRHSNPVYRIALKAREETRKLIIKHPDKIEAYAEDLGCACAIGSYILTRALKRARIPSIFVVGIAYEKSLPSYYTQGVENHCWIELMDGTIIDITATQFGVPSKLIFFHRKNRNYRPHLKGREAIKSLKLWPVEQNPMNHQGLLKTAIKTISA